MRPLSSLSRSGCGAMQNPPDWQEILVYFRGSELQNYFQKILEDDLKAIIKPQYVDNISKAVRYVATLRARGGEVLVKNDLAWRSTLSS